MNALPRYRSRFVLAIAGLVSAACLLAVLPGAGADERRAAGPEVVPKHLHWHSKSDAAAALRLLREGGNVVFMRHGKTDMLATDVAGAGHDDCRDQRNLSPMGRDASRELGDAWRLLALEASEVWSSPMCRCIDTAMLAFGRAMAAPDLAPDPSAPDGMMAAGQALLRLAAPPVAAGTNRIVVAHIFNARGALGVIPEEGEALILRPGPGGRPVVAGRLTATQWGDLVRDVIVYGLDPAEYPEQGGANGIGHRMHPAPAGELSR